MAAIPVEGEALDFSFVVHAGSEQSFPLALAAELSGWHDLADLGPAFRGKGFPALPAGLLLLSRDQIGRQANDSGRGDDSDCLPNHNNPRMMVKFKRQLSSKA
jgi:hypothetical protein